MVAQLRQKSALLAFIFCFLILAVVLVPNAMATRPYFEVDNSDVFTGGWFNTPSASCSNQDATYQAPDGSSDTSEGQYEGGILSFINNNNRGAGTNYAAYSLGTIQAAGASGQPYGFYSGTGNSNLTFATPPNPTLSYGGFFEGSVKQTHCIPDYFDTKIQGAPYSWASGTTVTNSFPAQYYCDSTTGCANFSSGLFTLVPDNSAQTLSEANGIPHRTTIFVKGNVYIGSNITYPAASSYAPDHTPKFALVVMGNIYIGPSVKTLDGLYIAQPDPANGNPVANETGVIWTCHDNSNNLPRLSWIGGSCSAQNLTINGAVIAKQVNFMRTSSDIVGGNPAEKINYTPAMVIGGPFFNPVPSPTLKIQSITSLPPIF